MTLREFLDEIGINELATTRSAQFRGREIYILDRGYNFEVYDIDDYLIATYDKGTRLFEYHGDKMDVDKTFEDMNRLYLSLYT